MGFIKDLFGGPEGPSQSDVTNRQAAAEVAEADRLRGLMKKLRDDDPIEEGVDFAKAGLVQFGSDSAEANQFGSSERSFEKEPDQDPFQWTLGMLPSGKDRLDHEGTLDWMSEQGILAEGGIDAADEQWLRDWMSEADSGQYHYLFRDDFKEGADGWDWDNHITEGNQTRLREFIALQDQYSLQLT